MGDDPNSLPPRFFKDDMPAAERKAIVMKAYERLKVSLDKFLKPDGSQEAPAKTCGDIKHHHPDFESGKTFVCWHKFNYSNLGSKLVVDSIARIA